jgi:hypothetical protein
MARLEALVIVCALQSARTRDGRANLSDTCRQALPVCSVDKRDFLGVKLTEDLL